MTGAVQKDTTSKLNAAVRTIYRALTAVTDAEATFMFEPEEKDSEKKDRAVPSGKFVEVLFFDKFGEFKIGQTQQVVRQWGAYPEAYFSVRLPCYIVLPDALQRIFASHAQNELFDTPFERIGLTLEISVLWFFDREEYVSLSRYTTDVRLDAFTESYFRSQSERLLVDLVPYLEWLQYFEHMASEVMEPERHYGLIADANMILAYLYEGGHLNFAKLTSLCDVAGSLQPVRNLIQKKRPELVI